MKLFQNSFSREKNPAPFMKFSWKQKENLTTFPLMTKALFNSLVFALTFFFSLSVSALEIQCLSSVNLEELYVVKTSESTGWTYLIVIDEVSALNHWKISESPLQIVGHQFDYEDERVWIHIDLDSGMGEITFAEQKPLAIESCQKFPIPEN